MERHPAGFTHRVRGHRAWLAYAERSDASAEALYRHVTERLARTNWTNEAEAQAAYQLLYAFHRNHLHFPGGIEHLRHGLRQCSDSILASIRQLLPLSVRVLFKTPVRPDEGLGGDAIDMLLSVYFYHIGLGREQDLRADAADLLPSLVRASPRIGNGITFCYRRRGQKCALSSSCPEPSC